MMRNCRFSSGASRRVSSLAIISLLTVLAGAVPAARGQQTCVDYSAYIHSLGNVAAPGFVRDIVVAQGRAYVTCEAFGLAIFDVTDPNEPLLLSSVDTPGSARGVAVVGEYAYVADYTAGLYIVDISNPLAPAIVGSASAPGRRVAVAGNYAYIAAGIFRVVDVSNPAAPVIVGSLPLSVAAQDVAVVGSEAYLAAYNLGLLVIDVSDPSGPAILGGIDTPDFAFEVAVEGDYAYLANRDAGLQIIDVSNPAAPVAVGSAVVLALSVGLAGNIAYVGGGGVRTVDITNPAAPNVVGGARYNDTVWAVAPSGDHLFIANATLGLGVAAVANPNWPPMLGSYDSGGNGSDIALVGEHLYLVGSSFPALANGSGLLILDVVDPQAPTLLGQVGTSGDPMAAVVAGNLVYVVINGVGLQVIDASTPAAPVVIGTASGLPTVYDLQGLAAGGSHVYLAAGAAGLHVVDVSVPAMPVHVGSVDTPGNARAVVLAGAYAFVADESAGLQVVDISDPNQPSVVAGSPTGTAVDLTQEGDQVLVAMSYGVELPFGGVQILDVSNPLAPAVVGSAGGFGSFWEKIATGGGVAYLAGSGLQVVDVSHPEAPVFTGEAGPVRFARGTAAGTEHVYVLDDGRVLVFPRHCATPTDAVGGNLASTSILRAWPNPARGQVTLHLALHQGGDIRLEVFDVAGRRVCEVLRGRVPAGPFTALWDGRDAAGNVPPSGIYFVRLSTVMGSSAQRVILLR